MPLLLKIQGALIVQELQIPQNVLLNFFRSSFAVNFLQLADDLLHSALAVADNGVVISLGRVVARGHAADLQADVEREQVLVGAGNRKSSRQIFRGLAHHHFDADAGERTFIRAQPRIVLH